MVYVKCMYYEFAKEEKYTLDFPTLCLLLFPFSGQAQKQRERKYLASCFFSRKKGPKTSMDGISLNLYFFPCFTVSEFCKRDSNCDKNCLV